MPRRLQPIAVRARDLRPGDRIIPILDGSPMREAIAKVGREHPYPRWGRGVKVVNVWFADDRESVPMKSNAWRVVVRDEG